MKPIVRQRLVELFTNKLNPNRALADIRDNCSLNELVDAVSEIEKKAPQQLSQFIRCRKHAYYKDLHDTSLKTGSLKGELHLLTLSVLRSANIIKVFIDKRAVFDKALILGEYAAARSQLDGIINSCGISGWSLEQELVLAQLHGGMEANKAFLASLQTQCSNGLTRIIAGMISSRIETNISYETFREDIIAFKKRNRKHALLVSYILAKINYIDGLGDEQIPEILHWTNTASCCDGYNTLLSLARLARAKNLKCLPLVREACTRIGEVIEDSILNHLLELNDPGKAPLLTKEASALVAIYDLALDEKWGEVIRETEMAISECPTVFDFYEWNAIARSNLSDLPQANLTSNPIAALILSSLSHIESQTAQVDAALSLLKKASMLLGHRALGYKIDAFWRRYREGDRISDTFRVANIACNASTPSMALTFGSRSDSLIHVQKWRNAFPHSEYLKVMESFFSEVVQVDEIKTSKANRALLAIQRLLIRGEAQQAADMAEDCMLRNGDDSLINRNVFDKDLFQNIVLSLFQNDKDYLAVRVLTRALLMRRIGFAQLLLPIKEYLNQRPSRKGMQSIYTPIFKAISGADVTDVHVAYANFMELHQMKFPSEVATSTSFNKQEVIWFSHRVCVYEVLEKSDVFENPESAERERIKLLKELQNQDAPNARVYSEEQVKLTQRLLFKKGLSEIDASKINVRIDALLETHSVRWREQHARYVELRSFRNLQSLLTAMLSTSQLDLDVAAPNLRGKFSQMREILFDAFKELFFDIRKEFLHNNLYGLNASLSTRIRHGILVRQVRSIFEEKRLVFSVASPGSVQTLQKTINAEWPELMCTEELARGFGSFSDKVNALALHLRDTKVQIEESAESSERSFNFYYTEEQLYQIFSNNLADRSFETFVESIFAELLRRTDVCLTEVRRYLSVEATNMLHADLLDLESKVTTLAAQPKRILDQLSSCRASMSTSLAQICNWFQISKETTLLDGDVELACEIATKMVASPDIRRMANIRPMCATGVLIAGRHFCSFVYVLFQFLDNAIKYGQLENGKIDIGMSITLENGKITIVVDNSSRRDKALADSKLINDSISQFRISPTNRGVGEGGTGLAKVLNIVEGEFARRNYAFKAFANGTRLGVELQFEGYQIVSTQ